jgi:hypothetical protein
VPSDASIAAHLHVEGRAIGDVFGVDEPQGYLGKTFQEPRHQWRHQQPAETLVDGHAELRPFRHRLQGRTCRLHLQRHALTVRKDGAAGMRQRDTPGGALQQPRAQRALQRRNRPADADLRYLEFAGRGGEAVGLHDPGEHRHFVGNHGMIHSRTNAPG